MNHRLTGKVRYDNPPKKMNTNTIENSIPPHSTFSSGALIIIVVFLAFVIYGLYRVFTAVKK